MSFPSRSILVTVIAALILCSGLTVILLASRPPSARFAGAVADLLPTEQEVPGWQIQRQAIADTPEMKAKVGELLNFSDGAFFIYTRGGQRLSVYIAYWTPGRMSHRLVAGHTPDVCWVGAGWIRQAAESGLVLPGGPGWRLLPGEQRTMTLGGNTEHVVFWHLLDGQPLSYRTGAEPPWYAIVTDMFSHQLNQRAEQFFIRVSSNEPVANWPGMAAYSVLTRKLSVLHENAPADPATVPPR
jgi:hypothetical protein